MIFRHHSPIPLTLDNIQDIKQCEPNEWQWKPKGLWISDDDDFGWAEWCKENSTSLLNKYVHNVQLAKDANLIWLRNVHDIREFTTEWGMFNNFANRNAIPWWKLAQYVDGIVITPFMQDIAYGMESASNWYYGWDVASGCIWNKRAIKSIKFIKEEALIGV